MNPRLTRMGCKSQLNLSTKFSRQPDSSNCFRKPVQNHVKYIEFTAERTRLAPPIPVSTSESLLPSHAHYPTATSASVCTSIAVVLCICISRMDVGGTYKACQSNVIASQSPRPYPRVGATPHRHHHIASPGHGETHTGMGRTRAGRNSGACL